MRILHVCADPGVPVFGRKGSSVHVQEVVRALRRRGDEVTLLCARTGGAPPDDLADLAVHALPRATRGGDRPADTATRERALMAADDTLGDVLAGHGGIALGPFDLVYERYSLWSTAAMTHARRRHVPSVLEVNAPLVEEQVRHRELVHRAEAEARAHRVLNAAGVVVAVSAPVAAWARKELGRDARTVTPGGVPGSVPRTTLSSVIVVPNGVDVDRIRPAVPRRKSPAGPLTVGFVGTLKPWHGVDTLLRAVAAGPPDVRVLLVGDGPERAALTALADDLGLGDRVEWTGAVDPVDVPAHLHRMDVAVAPYPDSPGMYFSPLKLYEYLAAGLAVVASDIGQVRGALTHDVDGLLVPPGDVTALAGALRTLATDPGRRHRLARAARSRAVTHHTWDAAVERIVAAATVPIRTGATAGSAA